MKASEALNLDQYKLQKRNSEFAKALCISSSGALTADSIKNYIEHLAEQLGEFISERGYKPSGKSKIILKVPSGGTTGDPTNRFATLGGKSMCELTATKDQYVLYASRVIDELKDECTRQIEKTWKGRLDELLTLLFHEKYPWLEYEEVDCKRKFVEQKDQLLAKVTELVENFEIPTLE